MGNATYTGRLGALTVALGMAISAANTPAVAVAEPADSSTALIMGGTTVPTPDDALIEIIKNQYIVPTHPGQDIEYVAVTTPQQAGPITGLVRLIGIALGPPSIWGPDGPGWWPDEPLWRLSGLFDLTLEQSVRAGLADLEAAMAEHGNDQLVIYGISQGSMIATREKRKLAEQYPAGTDAPDIDFVLQATQNLPNGGLLARFPGLYLPILDWVFDGPAPTDTQFDTVMINRQYDGFADFPLYPLNLVADLNALLGAAVYVHPYSWDVSLAGDPSATFQGTHGDTSYYFFESQDLPLFGPLRTLGVPEPVIDVVEPVFRVFVELGYDRSIPPWEPTPARLIPRHDPATVVGDLVDAIGEGFTNAEALISLPPPLGIPAPATTGDQDAAAASQLRTAVESRLPARSAFTQAIGAVEPVIGNGRTIVRSVIGDGRTMVWSASSDDGSNPATARSARNTPGWDAVTKASGDVKKVVTKLSDRIQKALSGGKGDDDNDNKGDGGAQ